MTPDLDLCFTAQKLKNSTLHYFVEWVVEAQGGVQQIFKRPVLVSVQTFTLHSLKWKKMKCTSCLGLIFNIPSGFRRLLNKAFGFVMMS